MESKYASIKAEAARLLPEFTATRRDFHHYAEAGWLEMRTASLIARRLSDLGYAVLTGPAVCEKSARMGLPPASELQAHYDWAVTHGADPDFIQSVRGGYTGVIGILRQGEGPTLALRFDIDALGVAECHEAAHRPAAEHFASVTEGVMDACGHDGHAAIGLGVAKLLMERKDDLRGTVKLIFQPAEEGVRGAKSIVEHGHLDDADYALAGHIFPVAGEPDGAEIGIIREGVISALATTKLDILFHGAPSHAGISPQLGKNALLAAATAVLSMHDISRYGDVPTQINVGKLTAGTGRNVVCAEAKMELEVRGQTSEANEYMEHRVLCIAQAAADMYECSCQVTRMGSAPALTNTWALSKRVGEVCEKAGLRVVPVHGLGGGSEDFSYMAQRVQSHGGQASYFGLLTPCAAQNHSDRFDFDEAVLARGVAAFCAVTLDLLGG